RVRRQLLEREVADRLAQRFVLVGEQEVLALRVEVGLQDLALGGRHRAASSLGWLSGQKLALCPKEGKRDRAALRSGYPSADASRGIESEGVGRDEEDLSVAPRGTGRRRFGSSRARRRR